MGKKKQQAQQQPAQGRQPGGQGKTAVLRLRGEQLQKLLQPPEDAAAAPDRGGYSGAAAAEPATWAEMFAAAAYNTVELQSCPALTDVPAALLRQQVALREVTVADCGLVSFFEDRADCAAGGAADGDADGDAEDGDGGPPLVHLVLPRNRLTAVPRGVLSVAATLQTLNLSGNSIAGGLPTELLGCLPALATLDLSCNQLTGSWAVPGCKLPKLTSLNLAANAIDCVDDVPSLPSLRSLFLQQNRIQQLPPELADCKQLKELWAVGNPIDDKRVAKLAGVDRAVDLKQLQKVLRGGKSKARCKGEDRKQRREEVKRGKEHRVYVRKQKRLLITTKRAARSHRPHLVCCVIDGIQLAGPALRQFIRLQTELHKELCDKRSVATIGTHDLDKVDQGSLEYDAVGGEGVSFVPLKQTRSMTPSEIVSHYERHDEHMRQHLRLIHESDCFAVLRDGTDVLSMAPLVNSAYSAISASTRRCLVEVTSDTSLGAATMVMEALLTRVCTDRLCGGPEVKVWQCRVVGEAGELVQVFPSHQDFDGDDQKVALDFEEDEARCQWFQSSDEESD